MIEGQQQARGSRLGHMRIAVGLVRRGLVHRPVLESLRTHLKEKCVEGVIIRVAYLGLVQPFICDQ